MDVEVSDIHHLLDRVLDRARDLRGELRLLSERIIVPRHDFRNDVIDGLLDRLEKVLFDRSFRACRASGGYVRSFGPAE